MVICSRLFSTVNLVNDVRETTFKDSKINRDYLCKEETCNMLTNV